MGVDTRIEKDAMGELRLPAEALWGAQTQRAAENFNISPLRIPGPMLKALGLIKKYAAGANASLGLLPEDKALAIENAAEEIVRGLHGEQFPVDVFQTGSGTSWNMNANEVIASLAGKALVKTGAADPKVHPNDDVNRGQSSNDVIPTAINVAARLEAENLVRALENLRGALEEKAREFADIPKLGRTHLQDAVPMTLGQEFSGYAAQMAKSLDRLKSAFPRLEELALGGTALGTGVNTPGDFAPLVIGGIAGHTGIPFRQADNLFEAIAARDSNLELMGALNSLAVSLMKIAQDLRLLASGPRSALGEIILPSLQPGSSIMPGKVNPVIPEMVIQAAAFVMGKHLSVTIACQNAPLELNIMQPLIAHELLFSLELLTRAAGGFAEKCVRGIRADRERCRGYIEGSLAMVTPLSLRLGYDRASELAYRAYRENRTVREIALEEKVLPPAELDALLNIDALAGLTGEDRNG